MINILKTSKELALSLNIEIGKCLYSSSGIREIINITKDKHGILIHLRNDHSIREEDFDNYYSYLNLSYEEAIKNVNSLIDGSFDYSQYEETPDSSTELMSFNKSAYVSYRDELNDKQQQLSAFKSEMKSILESKMSHLLSLTNGFKEKIKKLNRIIFTIELYLGIKEDIHQIGFGEKCSDDEPIRLLQDRLYMDEEVGDPTNNGIDITTLEDFDNWLLAFSDFWKKPNYEIICPYPKSIRIMRVRRDKKHRDTNNIRQAYVNIQLGEMDMETYLIIRNGESVYTINTTLNFGDKLFPHQDEFSNLYDKLKSDNNYYKEKQENQITDLMDRYKRNFIIIQGLIDRTDILGSLLGKINVLNNTAVEAGLLEFIYENENKIGDGTDTPMQWYEKAKSLTEGDRILYFDTDYSLENKRYYFYNLYKNNDYKYPAMPKHGIYTLYYDKEYKVNYIKIYPEIWDEDLLEYRDSKKSTRFKIDNHTKCINFDYVSHRHMNILWNMLHDRRERKHYLSSLASLISIRNYKLKEIELEKPFAKLIMSKSFKEIDELTAMDYIHWWKTKNTWKRPLTIDDSKALRMILKLIKNKN